MIENDIKKKIEFYEKIKKNYHILDADYQLAYEEKEKAYEESEKLYKKASEMGYIDEWSEVMRYPKENFTQKNAERAYQKYLDAKKKYKFFRDKCHYLVQIFNKEKQNFLRICKEEKELYAAAEKLLATKEE